MKDAAQEHREQIAHERGERIKKDYRKYLKSANERDADREIFRIFKSSGDVDKVISATVGRVLHTYPVAITAATFARSSATPRDPGALMASNAHNLATASSKQCYSSHRTELIRASAALLGGNVEAAKSIGIWDEPARYIAIIARNCSIDELKGENSYQARVRRTFMNIVSESSKPGASRFVTKPMLNFFGMEIGPEAVGLAAWNQRENWTKSPRVEEVLKRPDEVRRHENFRIWRITSRKDLEEFMAETLTYCGSAISKTDFWRYIKHCCEVDVMSLDDTGEQADLRAGVEQQVIGDVTAHDLFDSLTPKQREILMLRHAKTADNKEVPFREIAEELGISLATADGRYRDAIQKLRKEGSARGLEFPAERKPGSGSGEGGEVKL